ncbi:MAG: hypothetical protein ACRDGV_05685 [Candidatus Limnocylindria bacterium]
MPDLAGAASGVPALTVEMYAAVMRPAMVSDDVEFRRVPYDVEATSRAVLESELPDEFASQLREARGYVPVTR